MTQSGQTTGAKILTKDIVSTINQIKKLKEFVG